MANSERLLSLLAEVRQHVNDEHADPGYGKELLAKLAEATREPGPSGSEVPSSDAVGANGPADPAESPRPNRLRIAVYTIAKDESAHVDRWIDSIGDEADGVFVLDTGSTDDTVAKLRAREVVVREQAFKRWKTLDEYRAAKAAHSNCEGPQPWRFDTARNLSLCIVPEDFDVCIALDLDEVLPKGWRKRIEDAWERGKTTRLRYPYVWNHDGEWPTGKPNRWFQFDKVHARHGYHWKHAAHEILYPDTGQTEVIATITGEPLVEHWSPPVTRDYTDLLYLGATEDPECDRAAHYYARELMFRGRYDEAIAEFKRHLSLPKAVWKSERAASMRYIAQCIEKKARLAPPRHMVESVQWLRRACAEVEDERAPWYELAEMLMDLEDYCGCRSAAESALRITQRNGSYTEIEEAWGPRIYQFASIGAWYSGAKYAGMVHSHRAVATCAQGTGLRRILENNVKLIENKLYDEYSTHQRMLIAALGQYPGNVLEVGAGWGSTPLLHAYCTAMRRTLLTLDSNPDWIARFKHLEDDQHKLAHIPNFYEHLWLALNPWDGQRIGVALIDGRIYERDPAIRVLLDAADVLVLHDTEDPQYGMDEVLAELGKDRTIYRVDDKSVRPWTSVVSRKPLDGFRW